jgi:putative ABC transport system permease protein
VTTAGDRAGLIHVRAMRASPGRTALALLSVAASSAVLVGVLCVPLSIVAAAGRVTDLLPDRSILVVSLTDVGMDPALQGRIAAVDGVTATSSMVRTPVLVDGDKATLLGVDHRLGDVGGRLAPERCGFRAADLVRGAVAGPGIPIGDGRPVEVRAGANTRSSVDVVATATCPELADVDGGRVLLTALPLAEELLGRPGRADVVVVRPDEDLAGTQARLEDQLGGRVAVQTVQDQQAQAEDALAPLTQGVSVVALITAVVAGFAVYTTMSGAALARRREFAVLRALGLRRRSVRAGILAEGAVVGLAGSLAGSIVGIGLGGVLLDQAPRLVVEAVGYEPTFTVPSVLVVGVVVAVTATSIGASWGPARRLVDVQPVEALGGGSGQGDVPDAPSDPRWLLVAAVGLVAGAAVVLTVVTGPIAVVSMPLLTAAAILVGLALCRPTAAAASRLVRGSGASGALAGIDLRRKPDQAAALLLATLVAVSTLVSYRGLVRNLEWTYASRLAPLGEPDLVVKAGAVDLLSLDQRLEEAVVERIERVPGVAAVERRSEFLLNDGDRPVYAVGVEPGGRDPMMQDVSDDAVSAVLSGEGVVVNRVLADRHSVEVGDEMALPTNDGSHLVRVSGISSFFTLVPGGVVLLGSDRAADWYGRTATSTAFVRLVEPGDRRTERAVREVVGSAGDPDVSVVTGREYLRGFTGQVGDIPSLLNSILVATAVTATLAVLNSILVGLAERRRELAVLRALGTRRAVLVSSVVVAAAAVGLFGTAIGLAVGLILQPVHVHNLTELTGGSTIDYRFDWSAVALGVVGAVLVIGVGTVLPARRAVRADVVATLRQDS